MCFKEPFNVSMKIYLANEKNIFLFFVVVFFFCACPECLFFRLFFLEFERVKEMYFSFDEIFVYTSSKWHEKSAFIVFVICLNIMKSWLII